MAASFTWFAKWGWEKLWDWGTPPTFGAVGSGGCGLAAEKAGSLGFARDDKFFAGDDF